VQTLKRSEQNAPAQKPGARGSKRFSPLMLVGIGVTLAVILGAAGIFVYKNVNSHAAAVNMDCTLIVPADPLTAKGLSTPYQLVATNPANGACNEANKGQAAFVQGAVVNPATGKVSIYNPLVVDQGTQPAIAPVVPTVPKNAIVALWFGFNGNNLTLQGTNNSLAQGNCVNGQQGSIFGQFSYCNAAAFFASANLNIANGRLKVPPLGMGKDGLTCPTVRDFSVVDMDQSDNVTTAYVISGNGQVAQANAANIAALQKNNNMAAVQTPQMQTNASDNRLLSVALDGALGCTAWQAPDLADPGKMVNALPLDEMQAARFQGAPVALVPLGDPMTLNNAKPNLAKTTLYRTGVDQPAANNVNANTVTYCTNLLNVQPARMQKDMQLTMNRPSPDPAAANSLFTFLAQRFVATYEANGLNCMALLNKPDPIKVTTDGNGVATAATINLNGIGTAGAPNCRVNGVAVAGCATNAPVKLNGIMANIAFDQAANQVNITKANANQQAANAVAQPIVAPADQAAQATVAAQPAVAPADPAAQAAQPTVAPADPAAQAAQATVAPADPAAQAAQATVAPADPAAQAAQATVAPADPAAQATMAAQPTVAPADPAAQAAQPAAAQAAKANGKQKVVAPNCAVNGKVINGCMGFGSFNGRTLIVTFSKANNQVTITSLNFLGRNKNAQQNAAGQNANPTPAPAQNANPTPAADPNAAAGQGQNANPTPAADPNAAAGQGQNANPTPAADPNAAGQGQNANPTPAADPNAAAGQGQHGRHGKQKP